MDISDYHTAGLQERRDIRAWVVGRYTPMIRRYVRRNFPPALWRDAEQAGVVGLMVALKKYDPERGDNFLCVAWGLMRTEIRTWVTNKIEPKTISMDAEGEDGTTLHDRTPAKSDSVEDTVASLELQARLSIFLATVNDSDRRLLLTPRFAAANPTRYHQIIQRAARFLGAQ